jgi:hypothetical protein
MHLFFIRLIRRSGAAVGERDPSSYWVTGQAAADLLGANMARLGQLLDAGRLPYVRHRDGTRLLRRHQLEVIAQARVEKPATGVRTW